MKFFKRMTLLSIAAVGAGLALAGCKSNVKMPVTFVAVTSSEYNAAVTFGKDSYKFKGKVDQKSDKFTLEAIYQEPAEEEAQQGGQGQQGGPGGQQGGQEGGPGGQQGGQEGGPQQGGQEGGPQQGGEGGPQQGGPEAPIRLRANEDTHTWSLEGTYYLDEGYGYVLQLNDAKKSVIHADFNKTEGRHEFYYTVEINNVKSLVHFQAKDPTFKNSLAKDYKTWDQRDSKYIFNAKATGNNGSAATAYLYLHSDGSAKMDYPQSRSADRSVDVDYTWSEANGKISLKKDQKVWDSISSVNTAKPGFAIFHDDYTFICSQNPDVKWKKMEITDFKGASTHTFKGSFSTTGPDASTTEVELQLFADGSVGAYNSKSWKELGTGNWSDEAGSLHITLGNAVLNPYKEGDKTYVDFKVEVEESSPKGTSKKQYDIKAEQVK